MAALEFWAIAATISSKCLLNRHLLSVFESAPVCTILLGLDTLSLLDLIVREQNVVTRHVIYKAALRTLNSILETKTRTERSCLLMDTLEAAVLMASAVSPAREDLQRNFDHWYETVQKMDGTRSRWQEIPRSCSKPTGAGLTEAVDLTFTCGRRVGGVALLRKVCLQVVSRGSRMEEAFVLGMEQP